MPVEPVPPGDCYTLAEMIARYVPIADLDSPEGRHRAQRRLLFARQHKGLPHVYFGARTVMYPKAKTDAWLIAQQNPIPA